MRERESKRAREPLPPREMSVGPMLVRSPRGKEGEGERVKMRCQDLPVFLETVFA